MKSFEIDGEEKFIAGQYTKEREFWLEKLSGDLVKSSFPYDFEGVGKQERRIESVTCTLPDMLAARLIKASNGSDSRLHMLLVVGVVQLLNRYTGNEDIVIGIPIYRQQVEGTFVNSALALRNRLEDHMTFKDLLVQVKQSVIESNEHLNYPIEIIPQDLGITHSQDDNFPLFDVILLLENVHNKKYIKHINVNLVFTFERVGEDITGLVEFNSFLYKKESIERIIGNFFYLLRETLFNANLKIAAVPGIPDEERQHVLFRFNDTDAHYPAKLTIQQLFVNQVEATPHHTAVVSGAEQITYKQLNKQANRTAAVLMEKGVKAGTITAVMGKRCIPVVTGILAILKARGIYLPINARDPEERIRFILEDSKAGALITQEHLLAVNHENGSPLEGDEIKQKFLHGTDNFTAGKRNQALSGIDSLKNIIFIEILLREGGRDLAPGMVREQEHQANPDDDIYVLYTSGTSGNPKGVLVRQGSVVNYIYWAARTYIGNDRLDFPLYTSIAFDLTVTSFFTPLVTGNAVVLYGDETEAALIEKVVDDRRAVVLKLTPSHLKLIRDKEMTGKVPGIKRFILGGEELETQLAKEVNDNFAGNIEIYNEYGPTEATVGCMIYRYDSQADKRRSVPLGTPIANMRLYILDKNRQPVPIGGKGEIYISGEGVAAGYLNQPELTAEKFIPEPFLSALWFVPGDFRCRMGEEAEVVRNPEISTHQLTSHRFIYRTGDLARRLIDGSIEFLGRIDSQVKIRGYRIEIGEIESRLLAHEDIKEVVVVAQEEKNSDHSLCAYFAAHREFSTLELREYLSRELPDYMVPSYFVPVDKIPLTQNGKVDKRALPEPRANVEVEYTAPRNREEHKLVKIWSEILKIDEPALSIDGDFFDLGGHSLNATVLSAKVHKEFKVRVPLETIFRIPTIRGLSEYLQRSGEDVFSSILPLEAKEYYPLSSAQGRMCILQQLFRESVAYNIVVVRVLLGAVDSGRLEKAFVELIKRHESFRTSFEYIGDETVQRIHHKDNIGFKIECYEAGCPITGLPIKSGAADTIAAEGKPGTHRTESGDRLLCLPPQLEELINNFVRPFDLSFAPLLRVGLIKLAEETHILVGDMHHIITDSGSQDIFSRDFMTLYGGDELPPLRLQYRDFSGWQNKEKKREAIKGQEKYWLEQFASGIPVLNLPTDYARPAEQTFDGNLIFFEIGARETRQVKELAARQGATLFMVLLTLYYLLLSKLSGQEEIVIGTPVAGRRHPDLEQVMGLFVNTLAVKIKPAGARTGTFIEFLQEVKETALDAFDNQDYQFEDLVEKVALERDMGRNPVFDVMFILQNVDIAEFELPGLKLMPYEYKRTTAKFDLYFTAEEIGETLFFIVEYNTKLFKQETVERFIFNFRNILTTVIRDPAKKLSEIKRFREAESQEILTRFITDDLENEC